MIGTPSSITLPLSVETLIVACPIDSFAIESGCHLKEVSLYLQYQGNSALINSIDRVVSLLNTNSNTLLKLTLASNSCKVRTTKHASLGSRFIRGVCFTSII